MIEENEPTGSEEKDDFTYPNPYISSTDSDSDTKEVIAKFKALSKRKVKRARFTVKDLQSDSEDSSPPKSRKVTPLPPETPPLTPEKESELSGTGLMTSTPVKEDTEPCELFFARKLDWDEVISVSSTDDSVVNISTDDVISVSSDCDLSHVDVSLPSLDASLPECEDEPEAPRLHGIMKTRWEPPPGFYDDVIVDSGVGSQSQEEKHLLEEAEEPVSVTLKYDDVSDSQSLVSMQECVEMVEFPRDSAPKETYRSAHATHNMYKPGKAKVARLIHGYESLLQRISKGLASVNNEQPGLLKKMKMDIVLDLEDELTEDHLAVLKLKYESKLSALHHIESVVQEHASCEETPPHDIEDVEGPPPVRCSYTPDEVQAMQESEIDRLRKHFKMDVLEVPKAPASRAGYLRECSCGLEVGVLHWAQHLASNYHIQLTWFGYHLREFCWYNQPHRVPQDCPGVACTMCAYARDMISKLKESATLSFEESYVAENDELLQEFLEDSVEMDSRYFYCRPCDRYLYKEEFMQKHINSLLHKLKSGPSSDKVVYECKKCQVKAFTKSYYIRHLESQKHLTVMKGSYGSAQSPKESTPPSTSGPGLPPKVPSPPSPDTEQSRRTDYSRCEVCNISFKGDAKTQKLSFTRHVSRATHIRKSKEVAQKSSSTTYHCVHCDYSTRDKFNLDKHYKTKRHQKNAAGSLASPVDVFNSNDDPTVVRDSLGEVSTSECTDRSGRNYFMTFNRPLKYTLGKKLLFRVCKCVYCKVRLNSVAALNRHNGTAKHKERVRTLKNRQRFYRLRVDKRIDKETKVLEKHKSFASVVVIGNEYSNVELPFSHCHMFLQTKEKTQFDNVKKYIRTVTKSDHLTDIQRPKDIPAVIKYITKSDRRAFTLNCPTKLLSPQFKARLYFRTGHKTSLNWGHEIPSSVAQCDRPIFEDAYREEVMLESIAAMYEANSYALRPWQQEIEQLLNHTNNREVIWVVDQVGGAGKTTFASYLLSTRSCIVFKDLSYRENIYLYEKQQTVVFDLGRDFANSQQQSESQEASTSAESYSILEALKDGYAISKKYVPVIKVFSSPALLVLSNEYPSKSKLSLDRWNVQVLDDRGQMYRDTSYNLVD